MSALEQECLALLEKYNIRYKDWLKPLHSLLEEMERDGTELIEEEGKLIRCAKSVWVNVTYIDEIAKYQLVEDSRIFPSGFKEYRSRDPKGRERGLSETKRKGEDGLNTCLRLLREEAKFPNPCYSRLHTRDRGLLKYFRPLPTLIERESVAFTGLISRVELEKFEYHADFTEAGYVYDGKTISSVDEHKIMTIVVWREIED
jgi:hypothetical protein